MNDLCVFLPKARCNNCVEMASLRNSIVELLVPRLVGQRQVSQDELATSLQHEHIFEFGRRAMYMLASW